MAKYSGLVGYVTEEEISPGVWQPKNNSRKMRGDIIRQTSNNQNDMKVNNDTTLSHRVSLVGDAYAFSNYYDIKWIDIDGYRWKVSSVEVQRPRIIVSLGGPYTAQGSPNYEN